MQRTPRSPRPGEEAETAAAPVSRPLEQVEAPQESFKWTPSRTAGYVLTFAVVTWLTAFIITYMLVQVLLRVSQS